MNKSVEYYKNTEYAVKSVAPIWKYKGEREFFDRLAGALLDTTDWTEDHMLELDSYVAANWNKLTEEEYNEIVSKEKKED